MTHNMKSVRHLLKDKPTLKILEREISTQQSLLEAVRMLLPPDLAAHCLAARRSGNRLILHSDSPVWASRLRFVSAQLPQQLRGSHADLHEVRVRLIVDQTPPRVVRRERVHSDVAAKILRETAENTRQPALREALLRLSRTLATSRTQR